MGYHSLMYSSLNYMIFLPSSMLIMMLYKTCLWAKYTVLCKPNRASLQRHVAHAFVSIRVAVINHSSVSSPNIPVCDRSKITQRSNTYLYPGANPQQQREEKIKNEERKLNQVRPPSKVLAKSSSEHITIGYSFSNSFPNSKHCSHFLWLKLHPFRRPRNRLGFLIRWCSWE